MLNHIKKVQYWIANEQIILMAIVLLGLALRLYGIDLPLTDSHQIRQAQTAMMTRNLYEDGMNMFLTRLDFFGNNPGYIIMEFPLMHEITAGLYHFFGVHEILGRLVSVIFSVGAMFLMYGLARQFLAVGGALAALALYTFSPMNIFFSRAFMPESSMMFFMVGAVYFLLKWFDRQIFSFYLAAVIFAALTCLVKPTGGIILAPILAAWFLKYGWKVLRRLDFWLYMSLVAVLTIFWMAYAHFFNAINPPPFGFGGSWMDLLKARGTVRHWVSFEFYKFVGGSIILLLLTPIGFLGAIAGVFCAGNDKKNKILTAWLGALVLYFVVLAGPNSGHIYYHLPLLPVAVIFFGFAVERVLSHRDAVQAVFQKASFFCLGAVLAFSVLIAYGVGYFKYFTYMYSDRMPHVLKISQIVKNHVPKDRFIIDNESGLLTAVISYYCHAKAHPFSAKSTIEELESLRAQGATTFVTMETAYDNRVPATKEQKEFWAYLNKKYKPLAITDHYVIFDLRVP